MALKCTNIGLHDGGGPLFFINYGKRNFPTGHDVAPVIFFPPIFDAKRVFKEKNRQQNGRA